MKKLKKRMEEGLGTTAHSPTHSHIPHLLSRSDLPCALWCGGGVGSASGRGRLVVVNSTSTHSSSTYLDAKIPTRGIWLDPDENSKHWHEQKLLCDNNGVVGPHHAGIMRVSPQCENNMTCPLQPTVKNPIESIIRVRSESSEKSGRTRDNHNHVKLV